MNRGDVWWVNFDPAVGEEIQKVRPAVIVSNNIANKHTNRVTVIPLTSNTKKVYPSETLVRVITTDSKAIANQIMTADKSRLSKKITSLSPLDMGKVDEAIRLHLSLF